MIKILKYSVIGLVAVVLLLTVLVYSLTFHPDPVEQQAVQCPSDTPVYDSSAPLKVVSYNVQYMAGKDYVFFYDLLDNSGPDTRPSPEAIVETLDGIADLIIDLDADVLLLQELHENHVSTDYDDQTQLLLERLGDRYPCYTEAFYWKADFVPLPEIMGSVGMKLATLSKFKLENATRHQLSLIPSDPVTQQFNLKRAVLTVDLPTANGTRWSMMNTHLDAFSQGTDTMERQVNEVMAIIESVGDRPWVIGGDFNLLAEGDFARLRDWQRAYYNPQTELARLHARYPSIPSRSQINSDQRAQWFTHYPNDPRAEGPDRTIDYLFYDPELALISASVIQDEAIDLSDHLPVVGTFQSR